MSLMLDERQRAMLAEMGIKVWQAAAEPFEAAAPAKLPVPALATAPVAAAPAPACALAPDPAQALPLAAAFTPSATPLTPLAALAQAAGVHEAPVAEQKAPPPAPVVLPLADQKAAVPSEKTAVSVSNADNFGGKETIHQVNAPHAPMALVPAIPSGPVADMDWPTLRAAVSNCRACSLCESRTQTVFGVGAQRADWMVVGEAPGEQEDLRGEPFVGPAGQLLDAMLHAVGLNRQAGEGEQAVFIANALKCRPPSNRNPAPIEMAQCQPYLRQQVALVQPKIILAMGRFAVQALLGTTEPIGRLRQQVHSFEGVPVIVSYHPAYLLRNLPEKAKAWADLVLAMQVARQAKETAGQ